jgi:hypothetical protein
MGIKSYRLKISIKKRIREKQITIIKKGTKVDIKNQILRDKIKKTSFKIKYITIKRLRIKFDIINK